jgi:hypothetical protein
MESRKEAYYRMFCEFSGVQSAEENIWTYEREREREREEVESGRTKLHEELHPILLGQPNRVG